eukprot:2508309-Prymnesium_polylepis.1
MRVQDRLVKCWEEILQRPLQETCHFYLFDGIVVSGVRAVILTASLGEVLLLSRITCTATVSCGH